jgi:hypothetical protein
VQESRETDAAHHIQIEAASVSLCVCLCVCVCVHVCCSSMRSVVPHTLLRATSECMCCKAPDLTDLQL